MKMKYVLISLVLVVLIFISGCGYLELDTEEEIILGAEIALQVESYYDLYRDPVQVARVQRIGKDLSVFTTRPFLYTFRIIDSEEINAFAIPGGYIYIYKGLLDMGLSDDQLAGVMAHEITHIEGFHIAEYYERMKKRELFYTIAILATGGAAYQPIRILSYLDAYIFEPKYSRGNERECDISSVHMLIHSGRDPHAFSELFEMWEKERMGSSWLPGWMMSHPDFITRMNYIEAEISLQSALLGKDDASTIYPVLTFNNNRAEAAEKIDEEEVNLKKYISVKSKDNLLEIEWKGEKEDLIRLECYGLNKKQKIITDGRTGDAPFTIELEKGKNVKYLLASVKYGNGEFLWDVIKI